jgi:ribosomal 30S subunit maturation factor RimM
MRLTVGTSITDKDGNLLGTITDFYTEGHKTIIVINDDYEVGAAPGQVDEVIDLRGVGNLGYTSYRLLC